jgi:hypothetical protein
MTDLPLMHPEVKAALETHPVIIAYNRKRGESLPDNFHDHVLGWFVEWDVYKHPIYPTSYFGTSVVQMVDGTRVNAMWRIPYDDWYRWACDREYQPHAKQYVTNHLIRSGHITLMEQVSNGA